MCNPRRVVIELAEAVRQEWSRTVQARVTEQAQISAEATLETQVDLAAELGEVALEELRALLAEGFGGWQADGDEHTLALENGIGLRYHPGSGRLQVVARLSETVEAAASASGAASGVAEGSVTAQGVGRYYDDAWGGQTEARARAAAEREAQGRLAAERGRLVEEQQREAVEAARREAEVQARASAQAQLREERERRQAALEEHMEALLAESQEHVQSAIGALLGQTYRRAITRIVVESGGQVIEDRQQGAIIDLVARI